MKMGTQNPYIEEAFAYIKSKNGSDAIKLASDILEISNTSTAAFIAKENNNYAKGVGLRYDLDVALDYYVAITSTMFNDGIKSLYDDVKLYKLDAAVAAIGARSRFEFIALKFFYPVLGDLGVANIKLSTAIDLLDQYTKDFPQDPLKITLKYENNYGALARDLINADSNATGYFAALAAAGAEKTLKSRDPNWATRSQEEKDALIVTQMTIGPEKMTALYNKNVEKNGVYCPQPGEDEAGGEWTLQNALALGKALGNRTYGVTTVTLPFGCVNVSSVLAQPDVAPPSDVPTRNSANLITVDTEGTSFTVKSGGAVWDAYVLQKNKSSGFKDWNEYQAAIQVSNPDIADINKVQIGQVIYQPQKWSDGSMTYHYANGISINTNAKTGEYLMVLPNGADGMRVTYERILENGNYVDRYAETDPASGLSKHVIETVTDRATGASIGGLQSGAEIAPTGSTQDSLLAALAGSTFDRDGLSWEDDALLSAAELRTLGQAQSQGEAWGGARVLELSGSDLGDFYRDGEANAGVDTPLLFTAGSSLGVLPTVNLGSGSIAVDSSWMLGSGDIETSDSFKWNLGGLAYSYDWASNHGGYTSSVNDSGTANWSYSDSSSLSNATDWGSIDAETSSYYWDSSDSYNYFSPVALDMDGDGIELIAQKNSRAYYNVSGDGYRHNIGWLSGDDAFLTIDENGDGKISTARELSFAQWTGSTTDTDMEALKSYFDTNHNGQIDSGDSLYGKLRVWQDKNGDGVSDAGEVKTLTEAGIVSVSLTIAKTDWVSGGNRIAGFASYEKTDHTRGWAADLGLNADATGWQTSNAANFVKLTSSGGLSYGIGQSSALSLDMGSSGLDGVFGSAQADTLTAGSRSAVMMEGGAGRQTDRRYGR
jgi:hypothetical protein